MEKPAANTAQLSFIFGLKSDVNNNILFLDDQTIVYPYGTQCILYNLDQKTQKYLTVSEKNKGISALSISPNKRYLAVAERGGAEKPSISIYDLGVLRKRKALVVPTSTNNNDGGGGGGGGGGTLGSKEYVNLAFSSDSKYIAGQLGSPDWVLQLWLWEKAKLESSIKVMNAQQVPIAAFQVAFNPSDNTKLSLVGYGHVKFFKFFEGNLKQTSSLKLDNINYLCQCWLPEDKLVVGSENGLLLFFESEEFKHEINVAELIEIDLKRHENLMNGKPKSSNLKADKMVDRTQTPQQPLISSINNLLALSKGFACALLNGSVHVFERGEALNYKRTKEIKMPEKLENSFLNEQRTLNSVAISPNEEMLISTTTQGQLYHVALNGSMNVEKIERLAFELLTYALHTKDVRGVDVCLKKSIVVSCSTDQTIKIWDYDKNQLELSKEFPFEVFSITAHPSGLYMAAGFSDKLRFLVVLVDDLKVTKEFPVKASHKCSFSNGGHILAATNNNTLALYSTTLLENLTNFTGHNMKIKSFAWSKDDSKMASCADVIYEWDVLTGKRLGEVITKMVTYNDITYSPDGKSILVIGSDMKVKEIVDYQITREIEPINQPMTSLLIHNRLLFVSTASGIMGIVRYPLTEGTSCVLYTGHENTISGMRLAPDEQHLITSSLDGGVLLWKVDGDGGGGGGGGGGGRSVKKDVTYSDEVLIDRADYEELNSTLDDLKRRLVDLKMENDYQLRVADLAGKEKVNDLTEKFRQEMEDLRGKIETLKQDREKIEKRTRDELQEVKNRHDDRTKDIESRNNQKLMTEYEKYQELQDKSQRMQEEYERKMLNMEKERETQLHQLTEYHEDKLKKMAAVVEGLEEKVEMLTKEREEMMRQIEEDADREIVAVRVKLEDRVKEGAGEVERMRGQVGVMTKRFISMQREMDSNKELIEKGKMEITNLNGTMKNLEKTIVNLKREIQERDDAILEKEKRIYELKKFNEESEKFKFVLDYRIQELKGQVQPKDDDIEMKKQLIDNMEMELGRYQKVTMQLEANLENYKQRLLAAEKELQKERQKVHSVELVIQRFKTDLHNCVGYIQDYKLLKNSIRAMYLKHVQDDMRNYVSEDADKKNDFNRQRDHLEKTMVSLVKKHERESNVQRTDNMKIMQDNMNLIKEVNELRKELQISHVKIHDLEAAAKIRLRKNAKGSANANATTTTTAAANANLTYFNLSDEFKNADEATLRWEIVEKNKLLELQQEEMKKLRNILQQLEQGGGHVRPQSGQKLSPINNNNNNEIND